MQCNIDAKGKAVRLLGAILIFLVAMIIAALCMAGVINGWWGWLVAGTLAVIGAFVLFEARAGWCALRAMGFRTPV